MGAGKGNARRARASISPTIRPLGVDRDVWREFLESHDLEDVMVADYYSVNHDGLFAAEDHEKIIENVFADMVAVGAIVLPEQYAVEDFRFEMLDNDSEMLSVTTKKEPVMEGITGGMAYYFSNWNLSSDKIFEGMTHIMGMLRVQE